MTDLELVAECRSGNVASQTEFVRRFKVPIFRRMYRHVGSRELAEDLTQETLIRALTGLASLREMQTLDGWVHRIAMNLLMDHFRANRHRRTEPLPEYDTVGAPTFEGAGSDMKLISDEERLLIAKAVQSLPELYRDVIVMSHYDERPVAGIAAALGLGESAVKMRLQRARAMLAKVLEAYYEKD